MAHSPLPWKLGEPAARECIVGTDGHHVVCFGHDYDDYGRIDPADAVFIVRAVNCHQTLVDALKAALPWIDPDEHGLTNYEEARRVRDLALIALMQVEQKD